MRRLLACGTIALILLHSMDAVACEHDRDCPAASRCVKSFDKVEGVCERGVAPIEGDQRRRVGDPRAPKATEGKPCEFTSDCDDGLTCVAQSNSNLRVCSR